MVGRRRRVAIARESEVGEAVEGGVRVGVMVRVRVWGREIGVSEIE